MEKFSNTAYVAGTAALQDRCSRYSNENERIIQFPGAEQEYASLESFEQEEALDFYSTDFLGIYHAKHVTLPAQVSALFNHIVQKSRALYDVRVYGLKGKPFTQASRLQIICAGLFYASLALCALFIGY